MGTDAQRIDVGSRRQDHNTSGTLIAKLEAIAHGGAMYTSKRLSDTNLTGHLDATRLITVFSRVSKGHGLHQKETTCK